MLMFEVPGEPVTIDGKPAPMTISKDYSLSLSEKSNLRRDLQSWRGREFTAKELEGFAVESVVTVPCMLSVIHKQSAQKKTYANISSISGLPKGVQCPPLWHKAIKYEIEHGENDVFKALPEFIRKKISACEEWQKPAEAAQPDSEGFANSEAPPDMEEESDSVPF